MRDLELALGGHEKFVELCALYPTGNLSESELTALREHLESCQSCTSLLAEYRHLDRTVIPVIAGEESRAQNFANGWNQQEAKERLFENLGSCRDRDRRAEFESPRLETIAALRRFGLLSRLPVPVLVLALVVVTVIALTGGVSYFAGLHKGTERSARKAMSAESKQKPSTSLPGLVSDQQKLDAKIRERDTRIETLSAKIAEQSSEIQRLTDMLDKTSADGQQIRSELSVAQAQQSVTAANRDALQTQLRDSQSSLTILQGQLRQTLDQRTSDLMQTATLQRRIDGLNATLSDKDSQIQEQQTLLSSDRDIRELMGARDLFIADVFDIARDGTTKKPFGRVFYTKNKSLVFYAFDLDKQRDARSKEVAFQAWGLNDADKHRPVNLGLMFMDNQTNRRWVLKFDDPAVLERINAVFVTVEPSGGSIKPSGKQLLYAYLQAQPNHP
jgi:hypothetical protein